MIVEWLVIGMGVLAACLGAIAVVMVIVEHWWR